LLCLPSVVSCADSDPSGDGLADVRQAAESSLAADYFHQEITFRMGEQESRGAADYIAPDAARLITGEGRDLSETIIVGDFAYFSVSGSPDRYVRQPVSDGFGIEGSGIFTPLEIVKAAESTNSTDVNQYDFESRMPGADLPVQGTVTLKDGLVWRIRLSFEMAGEPISQRVEFTFVRPAAIVAPPASELTEGNLSVSPPAFFGGTGG